MVKDELDTGAPVGGVEQFNGVPMLPLYIAFLHDHRQVCNCVSVTLSIVCSTFSLCASDEGVFLLLQVFMYLLDHDADPNAMDISTKSCLLHWAAQRGCTGYVNQLIKYKADVNMMVSAACVCAHVCVCIGCVCVSVCMNIRVCVCVCLPMLDIILCVCVRVGCCCTSTVLYWVMAIAD